MTSKNSFLIDGENPAMLEAYQKAQSTFKYCWRELSWEYHRIVPALDFAYVKVAFMQEIQGLEQPLVECMWIDEISFDGEFISGSLLNEPNQITNITLGNTVSVPLEQICDWLFSSQEKTYGGFTIQLMRSEMNDAERDEHDQAWGLNFGDYNEVLLVIDQIDRPENLIEHPMSINMVEKLREYIQQNPKELHSVNEDGFTLLHNEAIAGNKHTAEVLLKLGADKNVKNKLGKTALDYAKQFSWQHLIPVL